MDQNNMSLLNFLNTKKTPAQQLMEKQKMQMMSDQMNNQNANKMLQSAGGLVDFFSNTYRDGRVGGTKGPSVLSTVNSTAPTDKAQSNMLGWMGKTAISGNKGISPLQLANYKRGMENDKYARDQDIIKAVAKASQEKYNREQDIIKAAAKASQEAYNRTQDAQRKDKTDKMLAILAKKKEDKDSLDERKFKFNLSKEVEDRYDKAVPAKDINKTYMAMTGLRNALEDGDVKKVESALPLYIRGIMGDVGNIAVRERELSFFKTIETYITAFTARLGAKARYSEKELQPLIDLVNIQIESKNNSYKTILNSKKSALYEDRLMAEYPDIIDSGYNSKMKMIDKLTSTIKYKGKRQYVGMEQEQEQEQKNKVIDLVRDENGKLVEVR